MCSSTTWLEDNQGSRCQVWTDCLSGQKGDSLLLLSWAPSTVIRRCFSGGYGEGEEESVFWWEKQMPAGPWWLTQLAMCFQLPGDGSADSPANLGAWGCEGGPWTSEWFPAGVMFQQQQLPSARRFMYNFWTGERLSKSREQILKMSSCSWNDGTVEGFQLEKKVRMRFCGNSYMILFWI